MYGAALAVPLGLTTRVSGEPRPTTSPTGSRALSQGRAEVVTLLDEPGRSCRPRGPRHDGRPRRGRRGRRPVIADDEPVPPGPATALAAAGRAAAGCRDSEPADGRPATEVEDEPPADARTRSLQPTARREGVSWSSTR